MTSPRLSLVRLASSWRLRLVHKVSTGFKLPGFVEAGGSSPGITQSPRSAGSSLGRGSGGAARRPGGAAPGSRGPWRLTAGEQEQLVGPAQREIRERPAFAALAEEAGPVGCRMVARPRAPGGPRGPCKPLSCGFAAPRGIRTPNRQIRSHASPVPACPSHPFVSLFLLVNGYVVGLSRASVPARHVRLGGNVVAVLGHRHQTRRLATHRLLVGRWEGGALDLRSGAPPPFGYSESLQPGWRSGSGGNSAGGWSRARGSCLGPTP